MKSEFVREDAPFTAQHFYLTLNYKAVHRGAFEIVAIRNWALVAGVMARLPSLPLPSACLVDRPCHAWLNWASRRCGVVHGGAIILKVGTCKGWCHPQGPECNPLLKTYQSSLNISKYHVTNTKATQQWECLFSYWFRLQHGKVSIYF